MVLVAGCAPAPRPATAPAPGPEMREADHRALLLLMADRRLYEPFSADRVLRRTPHLHRELALTLGRIGDPEALPMLEGLLIEGDPEARRAAAFALGLLGDPRAAPALLAAARDPDAETGRRAVEALARLELPLETALAAVEPLDPAARHHRLLPALFRWPAEELLPTARRGLAAPPDARRWAAYALARKPLADARAELASMTRDGDPWLRGWGARALGEVGRGADLELLRPLLDDAEPGPVIQSLRAARRLIDGGRAAPPEAWIEPLVAAAADPRPGVRVTALEAAAAWLPHPRLGDLLAARVEDGEPREREVALIALAAGGDARARSLALAAAAGGEATMRARAAEAAALAGMDELLARLDTDRAAVVRLAALGARLERGGEEAPAAARTALADPDPALRGAALAWLAEEPRVDAAELLAAAGGLGRHDLVEARTAAVRALAARAAAEPRERGAVVEVLERLALDAELAVRREAADGLERLERPRPALGPVETGLNLRAYRDLALAARAAPGVRLETERGALTLGLEWETAPLAAASFTRLVRQGFYDGLAFHRVVPDFVVQGGDPRGDGWGGPGYTLRDEVSPLAYRRGALGMARAEPDTAGSQFFITLSEQPHLEGAYTLFGAVVSGDEVLDRIRQGDRILAARVVEAVR